LREKTWRWFSDKIKSLSPIDILIVNGDAIDGKASRQGGVELLTADRTVQADMATSAIKFCKAKKVMMTYGTPYHTGDAGEDFEKLIADQVGADKIEAEGHYDINGLQVVCKHIIGNSASPVASMTAMRSAQVKQVLWALRGQQPHANLIIRSHIHRCYGIVEPGSNFEGWTTPALQTMGTRYGSRQCDGLPIDVGFLVVQVKTSKDWSVRACLAPISYQSAAICKL
jgi:hypothetical protein